SSLPKAWATISAVSAARGSGLVSRMSGRSMRRASPRAAARKRLRPRGVSGRSSSSTPGVPLGAAMACRMSRSLTGTRSDHGAASTARPPFPSDLDLLGLASLVLVGRGAAGLPLAHVVQHPLAGGIRDAQPAAHLLPHLARVGERD